MTGWDDVDRRSLRRAITAADGLMPLITVDPAVARRVVLDTLLIPPGDDFLGLRSGLGVVDGLEPTAALPENGPFFAFMANAPGEALEAIIELAEHATACWSQSEVRQYSTHDIGSSFEVLIGDEPVELAGNEDVMHWHRGDPRFPPALSIALMALEQDLYRRIGAGEDVGEVLERMMRSRSLALWGVLVSAACYRPELLKTQLRPLATSAALILADRLHKRQDPGYGMMTGLPNEAELRRLQVWQRMPHRSVLLGDQILGLMLSEGDLLETVAAARARWDSRPDGRWRFVSAQMDPANYPRVALDDGGIAWLYRAPAAIQAEIDSDQPELDASQWWLSAPLEMHRRLQAGEPLGDEAADALWTETREQVAAGPPAGFPDDGIVRVADAECGAAAVLLRCARDWTLAEPARADWCRAALLRPFEQRPTESGFDSAMALSETTWDGFCAEAIPILWAQSPGDGRLREAAFVLAGGPHYQSAARFFDRVAREPALAGDLHRLEHLALHIARFRAWQRQRAHLIQVASYSSGEAPRLDSLPPVDRQVAPIFRGFAEGSLDEGLPDLSEFVAATPAGMIGSRVPAHERLWHALDTTYLAAAWAHMLDQSGGIGDDERARRLGVAREIAAELGRALTPPAGEREPSVNSSERARPFLDRLAGMCIELPPDEARAIWQPVLAAGAAAEYAVDGFLRALWRAALGPQQTPPGFPALYREMLAFTAETERWNRGVSGEHVELSLLCLDRFGAPRMEARHRDLLQSLEPEWSGRVAARMGSWWFARTVAHFLAEPAAADLVAAGLGWLAEREGEGARGDDDLDEAIAELLVSLFARDPGIFRLIAEPGPSARRVLTALASRQNAVALELSVRVGRG